MEISEIVTVKKGASDWMKEHGYWLDEYPESIDDYDGIIIWDYTDLERNDSHYIVDFGIFEAGINPMWLVVKVL